MTYTTPHKLASIDFIYSLKKADTIVFDTETTGLRPHHNDKPFLFIIKVLLDSSWQDTVICDVRIANSRATVDAIIHTLWECCAGVHGAKVVVGHNLKFDLHMLRYYVGATSVSIGDSITCCDTQVAHRYVRNNLLKYSLDALTGKKLDTVKAWCNANRTRGGKYLDEHGKWQPAFWNCPNEILYPYAVQDVELTCKLFNAQNKFLSDNKQLYNLVRLESAVTAALIDVESIGIACDVGYANAAARKCALESERLRREYATLAGTEFVNSGGHIAATFARLGVSLPKTEKGNPKTDKAVLESLAEKHRVAKLILDIRGLEKESGTYYANISKFAGRDGRIHPDFRQTGADTMRFSCSNPNIQNVSNANKLEGFSVKGCFVASAGYKLLCIDFSNQEMRCAINLGDEVALAEKVKAGLDIHTANAQNMGVDRFLAKVCGFAILYGSGVGVIAKNSGKSYEVALRLRENFKKSMPGVIRYNERVMALAKMQGYITNAYGARLFIDKGYEYKALNYVIQSSCAHHTKLALVRCNKFLRENLLETRIIMQVHDELVFELRDGEEWCVEPLRKIMCDAYPHTILPMATDYKICEYRWEK